MEVLSFVQPGASGSLPTQQSWEEEERVRREEIKREEEENKKREEERREEIEESSPVFKRRKRLAKKIRAPVSPPSSLESGKMQSNSYLITSFSFFMVLIHCFSHNRRIGTRYSGDSGCSHSLNQYRQIQALVCIYAASDISLNKLVKL